MNSGQPNYCRGSNTKATAAPGKVATARCPLCGRAIQVNAKGLFRAHSNLGGLRNAG
jgi:hypothetical protein